ncbi:MAG TPA: condensation domain-containing protein, partial [Herpetosiphonaceae bacterium]|nr:condensation domain-containing protein [Herpetosiphonaceae bacterium]
MSEETSPLLSSPDEPAEAGRLSDYWRRQLQDWSPAIDLPAPPPNTAPALIRREFAVPAELLSATDSDEVLLAVFGLALFRYSRQRDLVVGYSFGDHTYRDHVFPIRMQIDEDETFGSLYRQVRETRNAAIQHAGLPAAAMAELLRSADRDPAEPALPALLASQPDGADPATLNAAPLAADLELHLIVVGDELNLLVRFDAATLDATVMERFGEHFLNLLAAVAAQFTLPEPESTPPVAQLPILSPAEQRMLLEDWNATAAPGSAGCVHHLIERQVDRTPHAVAVSDGAG